MNWSRFQRILRANNDPVALLVGINCEYIRDPLGSVLALGFGLMYRMAVLQDVIGLATQPGNL
jgi:hypothetical protein